MGMQKLAGYQKVLLLFSILSASFVAGPAMSRLSSFVVLKVAFAVS
jgi:hypothetical protein